MFSLQFSVWGSLKILNAYPYRAKTHFLGIDKRIAQLRGLQLNPIQNGGQLKLTSNLNFDRLPFWIDFPYITLNFIIDFLLPRR